MASLSNGALMTSIGDTPIEHHFIDVGSVTLHAVTAGPEDGTPVLLLHGFPEFWYGWRKQIPALAAAGNRVIALDQRGFNLSDKPAGVKNYHIAKLTADVGAVLDHFGHAQAHIVGHDFGAVVGWAMGLMHPDRVQTLTILNVPHPVVMVRTLRSSFKQMRRSWYMFFFQLPRLPEAMLGARSFRTMEMQLRASSRPGTFTDEDISRYRAAWGQPGALTAMLNWYRATLRFGLPRLASVRLTPPVLVIWGAKDRFLGVEMAEQSVELCDDGRLVLIDGATHWVQHEASERVNSLLLEFFAQG
ncbi:MAG: alpha/beta hydrolase [Anaerolineae bacterium]|nr:alpha/beta hydrolase [Anaerolineae bacterium]